MNDFYLKLYSMQNKNKLNLLLIGNILNKSYLFSMLANLVYDFRKKESVYVDSVQKEEILVNNEEAALKIELSRYFLEKIPYFFDKELLRAYLNTDFSMRDISRGSNISTRTIFLSLKSSKHFVRTNVVKELKNI